MPAIVVDCSAQLRSGWPAQQLADSAREIPGLAYANLAFLLGNADLIRGELRLGGQTSLGFERVHLTLHGRALPSSRHNLIVPLLYNATL